MESASNIPYSKIENYFNTSTQEKSNTEQLNNILIPGSQPHQPVTGATLIRGYPSYTLTMVSIFLIITLGVVLLASDVRPESPPIIEIFGEVEDSMGVEKMVELDQLHFQQQLASNTARGVNNRPIIGVLSQEIDESIDRKLPQGHNYTSYIAASYVKWIESGGARVMPVLIGKSEQYYRKMFSGLNGFLLPGGSAPLVGPGGFAEAGKIMFDLAIQANNRGDFFPVWGTCNGFELMTVMSMKDDTSRLTDCYSEDQALALTLTGDWRNSRIYGNVPHHIMRDLTKSPVTINFHHFCLTPTNFTRFNIDRFWKALSVNRDSNGLLYISTIEAKDFPFIGVQFHPEKNTFEWNARLVNIPHSSEAVNVSNYLARFLVNLARGSKHSFTQSEVEEYLIYKYKPLYSGNEKVGMTFEQVYLFK